MFFLLFPVSFFQLIFQVGLLSIKFLSYIMHCVLCEYNQFPVINIVDTA